MDFAVDQRCTELLTFVPVLLSPQFLAEDYSLVDVLYYVTRDDLKCLRLRYHFSFHLVVMRQEHWAEIKKTGFLPWLGPYLTSSNYLHKPGLTSLVLSCSK